MRPRLIVLSAPSGAGKTTLCRRLYQEFSDNLVYSISHTTRKPRAGEVHGKDYFFVSEDEFQKTLNAGRFAESAQVHNHFYGTSKDVLESALRNGSSIILDIDVQGAFSLKKIYPEQTLSIFIAPPNMKELETRLKTRATDSETIIQTRIQNARDELERAKDFDYKIINDDLERAYQELRTLLIREKAVRKH